MHNLKVLHALNCPFTIAHKACKCSPLHGNEGKETEGQRCAAVNMYKDLMYHHTLKFPAQHRKSLQCKNSQDPCLLPLFIFTCQKNQHKMGIQVSSMTFCFNAFRITFKELIPAFSMITLRLTHIHFKNR